MPRAPRDNDSAEPVISQRESMDKIMGRANYDMTKADKRRKELYRQYKDEAKVDMYLSSMYRPYFGNVMKVSINGSSIFFKVDGSVQKVPKTFADEITNRRLHIDAIINKQHRMANIVNNIERTPGELRLF
jgi:hypothetical protein